MSHLRGEISALVDGQLPPEEAEAALEHVVACEGCAQLLAAERAFRRRLAQARDVRPSEDLTDRLMRLEGMPVPESPTGPRALVDRVWGPLTYASGRRRMVAGGSLVMTGAFGILGILLIVGALYQRTGDPVMMLDEVSGPSHGTLNVMTTAEPAAAVAQQSDRTESALSWLRENGWAAPEALPSDATINLVGTVGEDEEEVLVVEFTRFGRTATLLEQRGVLDVEELTGLERIDLGAHQGHRLPGPGDAVVLECAGTTVLVTSSDDPELVRSIAAALPATEPGPGMADRLDQGWDTVVGWTDLLLQTP
ncbi:anti-sigma factor family protein [Georgenia alba]|uniref:Anti-sigma factor family protein n=1 Tax=Georgenia alba TaxID=2233858 RepID=A0ABW2QCC4_9MICO